jgi:hypothetical protein
MCKENKKYRQSLIEAIRKENNFARNNFTLPSPPVNTLKFNEYIYIFFPMARQPLGGVGRLIFEASRSHIRHTTLSRTPLDELPARRRNLYLTTHNTHKRQTPMPPVGFEPTILVSERSQTHVLDRTATVIDNEYTSIRGYQIT